MCFSLDKFLVFYDRAVQVYFSGFDLVPVQLCAITFTRPVMRERMMNEFFFSNCCYYCKIITRAIELIMYIIKYYI